jgi:hypothetical protein
MFVGIIEFEINQPGGEIAASFANSPAPQRRRKEMEFITGGSGGAAGKGVRRRRG